jgi:carboxypeptidase C (cathepsin A)
VRQSSDEVPLLLTPLLLLLLSQAAPPAAAQGRGAPQAQQAQPTQAGRGPAGSGAVFSGAVDETPVVTKHSVQVGGKTLNYTATVAQMPLKDAAGDTEAHIFYTAYTLDSPAKRRPLTFAFNGGPGSASIWVHMGAMGPRMPKLLPNGSMPPPPYEIVDNPYTWLDVTDLVFIDPVGTGYSRAKSAEVARRMNGVQGDLQSVGEFIRMYVTRNNRQLSPLFLAGESYGTFRSAGLAGYLIDRGLAFNGVILLSTTLNLETIWSRADDLVYALEFPTYAADAWYHKKVAPEFLKKDLRAFLKDAEGFAMGDYLTALNRGDELTAAERKTIVEKIARFSGLEHRYIEQSNLRFDVAHFTRELLREKNLTIGRLDGRLTGPASHNTGETSEFDPSNTLIAPPFGAAFQSYVRGELEYKTDLYYHVSGGIMPWDWGVQNGFADSSPMLRNAFAKNPYMKVLVAASYYDLATPYYAAQYTFNHMGLNDGMRKNVQWTYYQSGHMMYIDSDERVKLKKDIADFITASVPKSETP